MKRYKFVRKDGPGSISVDATSEVEAKGKFKDLSIDGDSCFDIENYELEYVAPIPNIASQGGGCISETKDEDMKKAGFMTEAEIRESVRNK